MKRNGFTLIELAIALVIIGLLIGTVLKGRAMIEQAKVNRVASDVHGIVAAVYDFQNKYGYLPGDDPNPIPGSGGCTGNGNGLIQGGAEELCAWKDLIASGFISGNVNGTTLTTVAKHSPYGGYYNFYYNNRNGQSGTMVTTYPIPNDVVQELDRKYDDDIYNTGTIQDNVAYPTTTNATVNSATYLYWWAF